MQKNTIQISPKQKKELADFHNTSKTTVQMSLDFYNNSDLARAIRRHAKQLLMKEAAKIKD